ANGGPSDHFGIAVALYGNHLAVGARYHASATGRSGAVFSYEWSTTNEFPVIEDDFAMTAMNTAVTIDVLNNDSDPNGTLDLTTLTIIAEPDYGTAVVNGTTGVISYTPPISYSGIAAYAYQVCDDGIPSPVLCDSAAVVVVVTQTISVPPVVTATVSVPLGINSDDAGINPVHFPDPHGGYCQNRLSSNEIYFGECADGVDIVSGFHFPNVPVPPRQKITKAHIEFTVDGLYDNNINVAFHAEDSGDSQTFTDISTPDVRPLTNVSVTWSLTAQDIWNWYEKHNSPDLAPVVQEVVNRSDWQSGNALSIIATNINSFGDGRRVMATERPPSQNYTTLFVSYGAAPPDLSIQKIGPNSNGLDVIWTITYTLIVENNGGQTATNLIITDTLPTGSSYESGGTLVGDVVYWYIPYLAPGEQAQVHFSVDTGGRTITNRAYGVTADNGIFAHGEIPVTTVSVGSVHLFYPLPLYKTAPDIVNAGDLITYTLTLSNPTNQPIYNLSIQDSIPPGAFYVSGGIYDATYHSVNWYMSELGIGETIQVSYVVTAYQTLVNQNYQGLGRFLAGSPDHVLFISDEDVVTLVNQTPMLVKKTGPAIVYDGQPITYTLTVTNTGAFAAGNVIVTDTLPLGATYLSGGVQVGGVISWTLPVLNAGEAAQVQFSVMATDTVVNETYGVRTSAGFITRGQDVVTTYVLPATPPITFTLGWALEGEQANANYGYGARPAGDVNGDGYDDVIIGAYRYDNDETDEGRAWLYYGSSNGLKLQPAWTADGEQSYAWMGLAVAAGDVNNDGYDDVIVGSRNFDSGGYSDNGRVDVYYGTASGLAQTADWTAYGNQNDARFGHAVASAGDVNGDGYTDIIIGARGYSNGESAEGGAYVYYGSATGLSSTPAWTAESNYANAWFGYAVDTAGDVNNDGYADVIIGSPMDGNGTVNGGKVYGFYGSGSGLSATPDWLIVSDQDGAGLGTGTSVASVGDVNGDGYDDALVGAQTYDNPETNEGQVYLYYGSANGLNLAPAWTAESNQANANFGWSVAAVGDVNLDGFADFIIGADSFDTIVTDAGQATLYLGSPLQPDQTPYWTETGSQQNGRFGHIVGSGGDVDGNGYNDLLIGEQRYSNDQTQEGRVLIYYTSPVTPVLSLADFIVAPVSGTTPHTAVFTNTSAYAANFLWDFGDTMTSTLPNPIHTYTRAGVYTVILTAANPHSLDVLTRTHIITVTRSWQLTTTLAPPVWGEYTLAYDSGEDMIYLYGGNAHGWPYENATWEFDDFVNWRQVTTAPQPNAVYGMAMVYDDSRDAFVLFGGSNISDTAVAETWEFDGDEWTQITTTISPPTRTHHALAYDPVNNLVYLFGGQDGAAYYDDLWTYDGTTWSQVTTNAPPPARSYHAMAYNPDKGTILLFGGRDANGVLLPNTWEYYPLTQNWYQVSNSGPAGRLAHSMVYDPGHSQTLLVGGISAEGDMLWSDTWAYTDLGWQELTSAQTPPAAYHTLIYRSATDTIFMLTNGETWQLK
ncbi:MAG: DUF11 domain-containing protein, partial [Chloroflexi bacterium]|nr:DUF11 domain-containing protein [Chloroflexota bacterium]